MLNRYTGLAGSSGDGSIPLAPLAVLLAALQPNSTQDHLNSSYPIDALRIPM